MQGLRTEWGLKLLAGRQEIKPLRFQRPSFILKKLQCRAKYDDSLYS